MITFCWQTKWAFLSHRYSDEVGGVQRLSHPTPAEEHLAPGVHAPVLPNHPVEGERYHPDAVVRVAVVLAVGRAAARVVQTVILGRRL